MPPKGFEIRPQGSDWPCKRGRQREERRRTTAASEITPDAKRQKSADATKLGAPFVDSEEEDEDAIEGALEDAIEEEQEDEDAIEGALEDAIEEEQEEQVEPVRLRRPRRRPRRSQHPAAPADAADHRRAVITLRHSPLGSSRKVLAEACANLAAAAEPAPSEILEDVRETPTLAPPMCVGCLKQLQAPQTFIANPFQQPVVSLPLIRWPPGYPLCKKCYHHLNDCFGALPDEHASLTVLHVLVC